MGNTTKTTGATAIEATSYDGARTNLTISNLSGETCYMSTDPNVAASGSDQGEPIFNNGRFEANWSNGRDPRLARFIIGSAGGQIIIGMEWYKQDPVTVALEGFKESIRGLVGALTPKPFIPVQDPTKEKCNGKCK